MNDHRQKALAPLIEALGDALPRAFRIALDEAGEVLPLTIGVDTDLDALLAEHTDLDAEARRKLVRRTLTQWTRTRAYRLAVADDYSQRHSLDAEPLEYVSTEHRQTAAMLLLAVELAMANRAQAKAKKVPEPKPQPKPEPQPEPKPQPLSLKAGRARPDRRPTAQRW
jgi:sRNA-binding protein